MSRPARAPLDAVIVGAGPAGAAAAILLARAGWAVALVEKHTFPRRKVCGECVAASNLAVLEELGVAAAFEAHAGAELRRVTLWRGQREVTAQLPAGALPRHTWGRAVGREVLDGLLLDEARAAGAEVLQPWSVQAIQGLPGRWHCWLRAAHGATLLRLRSTLLIDAHGSWEELPAGRPQRQLARSATDLFAFKANFAGSALDAGAISVLALNGGYGGMVVSGDGVITLACCIRRDRLSELRGAAPGLRAGDAVLAWLLRECEGVRRALHGATRDGPWLASGPLDPGVRVGDGDGVFRIGNAAGEAHPILGEGISMALQSAALLCRHLLRDGASAPVPAAPAQAAIQAAYGAAWRRHFTPRLRVAALFGHAAMRPPASALLLALAQRWPGLLTQGARWGGKAAAPPSSPDRQQRPARPGEVETAGPHPSPLVRGLPRQETP